MSGTVRFGSILGISCLVVGVLAAGCADEAGEEQASRPEEERREILAEVDSVLMELGGEPATEMGRGQRWRMISSIGAGLPPPAFEREDLPEPDSRGAQLLQAYCVQCHWIPAPRMHAAEEWPVLMRRMILRARTLRERMGGPVTEGLVGEFLLSGMASAEIPSPAHVDTMLGYLQAHAMPAVDPAELGDGEDVELFLRECAVCHEPPDPGAHTLPEWRQVVSRMSANMAVMGLEPLTDRERDRILSFLRLHGTPEP
ncbi:MAG: hypothetical protein R3199_09245 [Gemmatimonadota bacterium]|nr:hypothetical protein [Gemmatimonadota bacterium]